MTKDAMQIYRFKNLDIKHEGKDYLVNGLASYSIEDYEEDGKQACFESAETFDALGYSGLIIDKEKLKPFTDSILFVLNRDSHLCRVLGSKSIF